MKRTIRRKLGAGGLITAVAGIAMLAGAQSAAANTWVDTGQRYYWHLQCYDAGRQGVANGSWIDFNCQEVYSVWGWVWDLSVYVG